MDEIEDMDHLWRCPAFNKERTVLRESMKKKLSAFCGKNILFKKRKVSGKAIRESEKRIPSGFLRCYPATLRWLHRRKPTQA